MPARRSFLPHVACARVPDVDGVHRAGGQDQSADAEYYCVERIERALNDMAKPVKGSRVAIIGVSYKGGTASIRESPALRIMEVLKDHGRNCPTTTRTSRRFQISGLRQFRHGDILVADVVVLVTAHPGVEHEAIADGADLFIDLRGVTRGQRAETLVRL